MPALTSPSRALLPISLIHSWVCPPVGHPLWSVPGFCPIARFRVDSHNTDRPPGDTTSYASTPQGSAALAVSWLTHIQTQLRRANNPSAPYVTLFLQNWGITATNAHSLCRHASDATPASGVSSESALDSPYCANGIAANLAWTTTFAETLALLLPSDVYPPHTLLWDWEARVRPFLWFPTPPDGTGSWDAILADSRFSSESITPSYTYEGTDVLTLSNWLTKAESISPDTTSSYWDSSNDSIRNLCHRLSSQIAADALNQALFVPIRASFPSLLTSSYAHTSFESADQWIPDKSTNLGEAPGAPLPLPSYLDYQSPVLYLPSPESFHSNSPFTSWTTHFQINSTSNSTADLLNLTTAMQKRQLTALATSGRPLLPWISTSGYKEDYSGTTIPSTPIISDTQSRQIELARHAYNLGCRDFALFTNLSLPSFSLSQSLPLAQAIAAFPSPSLTRFLPKRIPIRARPTS